MKIFSRADSGEPFHVAQPTAADLKWQRVWFSTIEKPWSSLAIIPTDPGISVEHVAKALVDVGRQHSSRPIIRLNALGLGAGDAQTVIAQIASVTGRGDSVVVAFDSVLENPAALPIIRAMSAALLVVRAGTSRLSSVRRVADAVGRERVRGSLVLD